MGRFESDSFMELPSMLRGGVDKFAIVRNTHFDGVAEEIRLCRGQILISARRRTKI
jgi:hypothetical protein